MRTSLTQQENDSTDSGAEVTSDINFLHISDDKYSEHPGRAYISRSRDVSDQSPASIGIGPQPIRSRATDDQSLTSIGAASQPIAELIRREFEQLRVAPSRGSRPH